MGSNDELVAAGKAGCIAHCACPDDADVGCILATGPGLLYTGSLRKRQKLVSNVHVLQGAMMAGCTFGMAGRGLSSVPSRLTRTLSTLLQRTPACHTWQHRALRTKCGSGAPTALRRACLRTSLNKSGKIRRASPTGPILQSQPGCLILQEGRAASRAIVNSRRLERVSYCAGCFPLQQPLMQQVVCLCRKAFRRALASGHCCFILTFGSASPAPVQTSCEASWSRERLNWSWAAHQ